VYGFFPKSILKYSFLLALHIRVKFKIKDNGPSIRCPSHILHSRQTFSSLTQIKYSQGSRQYLLSSVLDSQQEPMSWDMESTLAECDPQDQCSSHSCN
jgi:hypothetical protein